MNVDPLSAEYGNIVPWDSLTDAQKQSGQWIKLPSHDENGEPVMAKPVNPIDALFATKGDIDALENVMRGRIREFDAVGYASLTRSESRSDRCLPTVPAPRSGRSPLA